MADEAAAAALAAQQALQAQNQALLTAINALTTFLTTNAGAAAGPPAQVPHIPLLDPFASPNAFDISSRAGSTAFHTASSALLNPWNGEVDSFPPFVIALKLRAREMHWTAVAPTGICTLTDDAGTPQDLFDSYFSLTPANAETARAGRLNDRSIQNSRAMYQCLKKSISGALFTIIFEQAANLPYEDGPILFLVLTDYTVSSTVQLSMNAVQRLMVFDPAFYKYEIPRINTSLLNLFLLAASPGHRLNEPERLQYILTIYLKIRQPESWASWVRTQTERVEDGALASSQVLLNKAVLKYNLIKSTESEFKGSTLTIQEDIVAMLATRVKKPSAPSKEASKDSPKPADDKNKTKTEDKNFPPFVKHYKSGTDPAAVKYKLGDTKDWKGTTYYFCDCPKHRERHKWHPHKAEECNTRKLWLEQGGTPFTGDSPSTPNANLADSGPPADTDVPPPATDATAMLATIMNSLSGNSEAQASIADAINSISQE